MKDATYGFWLPLASPIDGVYEHFDPPIERRRTTEPELSLRRKECSLTFQRGETLCTWYEELEDAGMDMHDENNTGGGNAVLSISGMTCSGCATTVTRVLSRIPGVTTVNVDLGSSRATVMGSARSEDLIAAVQAAGYGAQISRGATVPGERNEPGRGCC